MSIDLRPARMYLYYIELAIGLMVPVSPRVSIYVVCLLGSLVAYNWGVHYLSCPGKIGVLNWGCNNYGISKNEDGELRRESWNYGSVIRMLNYLVHCSHPDLSFAVHQCARFCNDPKKYHDQLAKRILR